MRNVQLIFNPLKFLRWFKSQDMFSLYVTNDIKQNQIEANLKLTIL